MELSTALKRVRQLIEKAEHPIAAGATPEERAAAELEQQSARKMADKIMQEFAIQEWQAQAKAPQSFKPDRVKIDIGQADSEFLSETATLCNVIADFCNCTSIWMKGSGVKWGDYSREEYCWVYGYESDLRYFELLFTTLYLHMVGAIFPQPDLNRSIGENAYELRNAGLNWIEIAKAYGWREVPRWDGEPKNVYVNDNDPDGKRVSWSTAVGRFEQAYRKVIKAKGESIVRIPPNGARTYRMNAAQGYLARISQRLRMVKSQRGTGTEMTLRDKSQNITALIEEMHPDMSTNAARKVRYNADAYRRGTQHADTASLNPAAGAGGSGPAIGA